MATVIKTTFLLKRSTSKRWSELNPILQQGEPGFAYDTNVFKIGDGVTPWNDLVPPYETEQDKNNNLIFVDTLLDLPNPGEENILYIIKKDSSLYTWYVDSYKLLNPGINLEEGQVVELYGGSATDNI